MPAYRNASGNSGVITYEVGENSITVRFRDGSIYLYDHRKPGIEAVNRMKSLAERGEGLNSYISSHVRNNYAAKLR